VALCVDSLPLSPAVPCPQRRRALRDRRERDLNRTLHLYLDACKTWAAKLVAAPLANIEADATLDFEPRPYQVRVACTPTRQHHSALDSSPCDALLSRAHTTSLPWMLFWMQVEANSTMFQTRMMQLKVRVKAIVGALKGSGLPPDSIVNFLVTLLEDDNYFPQVPFICFTQIALTLDGPFCMQTEPTVPLAPYAATNPTYLHQSYIWPCESEHLEFTDLGGTRNVIRPLDPPKAQGDDDDDDDDDDSEGGGGDGGGFRDEPDEDLVPFSPNALSVLVKDMGTSVQASCVCTPPSLSPSHPQPCPSSPTFVCAELAAGKEEEPVNPKNIVSLPSRPDRQLDVRASACAPGGGAVCVSLVHTAAPTTTVHSHTHIPRCRR